MIVYFVSNFLMLGSSFRRSDDSVKMIESGMKYQGELNEDFGLYNSSDYLNTIFSSWLVISKIVRLYSEQSYLNKDEICITKNEYSLKAFPLFIIALKLSTINKAVFYSVKYYFCFN